MKIKIYQWQPVCAVRMEEWNIGILGVRKEINRFSCKNFFKPIIPLFHLSNWGEAPNLYALEV